jgi:hypothetical protein
MKRHIFATLAFLAITTLSIAALAQSTPPAGASAPLTTLGVLVTVVSLVVGFVNQAVNQGSILGIVTTPKAWLPYLTILATFFMGAGASLSQAAGVSGSSILAAVLAGFSSLVFGAGGIALAHGVHVGKLAAAAAKAKAATPAPETKPSA